MSECEHCGLEARYLSGTAFISAKKSHAPVRNHDFWSKNFHYHICQHYPLGVRLCLSCKQQEEIRDGYRIQTSFELFAQAPNDAIIIQLAMRSRQ